MSGTARVVLTGAGGFLGSHLCRDLIGRDFDLLLVLHTSPPPTAAVERDVAMTSTRDPTWLDEVSAFNPTCVIHAATRFQVSHSRDDIAPMVRSNVELGTQLLDVALSCGSRFVTLSSAWQRYEGRINSPVNLYAATKQAFDSVADFYQREGLNLARLFLFDVYGPSDTRQKLVPLLMSAAATKQPLPATSGEQLIDLTFVDDVVRAITDAAFSDKSSLVIDGVVKSGAMTVRHVAEVLSEAIGRPVPVQWGEVPDRPKEMLHDWELEPALPGWSPIVSLPEGLVKTWEGSGYAS